jgi:hypothetical protein
VALEEKLPYLQVAVVPAGAPTGAWAQAALAQSAALSKVYANDHDITLTF